ncbi:type III secretion T3S chaperone [Parachlamydia acanthamoebae UV-7]|uniref:Type III secretion T3S chaperone n=2 Tax=Parachlamydia acanthamoebae TaxID=83552 RepID=F8KX50_PARAV|nr:type III secretion T3S chaperone [Parachlamydia acanthamoebae]KIA78758.1 Type III secretion T3S chaperone [Parachlamydia acanthamoebae]CCB85517.1 type III secretion T3S chaperone [Parachlamydia acanthamoebae UV-7]
MAKVVYPLQQVLQVKQRRVEDAERVVADKKLALEREKETLAKRKAERDKVLEHLKAKMDQMRYEMDHGTTSPKILQMKVYIKIVQERLKVEEKKVADQKEQVTVAEKNLEIAKEELKRKRQEVDKLMTHRKDWLQELKKEEEIIEGREQDELGSVMYMIHQRK